MISDLMEMKVMMGFTTVVAWRPGYGRVALLGRMGDCSRWTSKNWTLGLRFCGRMTILALFCGRACNGCSVCLMWAVCKRLQNGTCTRGRFQHSTILADNSKRGEWHHHERIVLVYQDCESMYLYLYSLLCILSFIMLCILSFTTALFNVRPCLFFSACFAVDHMGKKTSCSACILI